jgi:hypothetical protein
MTSIAFESSLGHLILHKPYSVRITYHTDYYTEAAGLFRRAYGTGELLVADLFARGMLSLVAAIIACYHGDVRLVASG